MITTRITSFCIALLNCLKKTRLGILLVFLTIIFFVTVFVHCNSADASFTATDVQDVSAAAFFPTDSGPREGDLSQPTGNLFRDFVWVWGLFMLTVISPGPDFLIVTKASMSKGLRVGLMTALGIGTGLLFHCFYCLTGIALAIKHTPMLFAALRIAGGLYLGWLGVKSLQSAGFTEKTERTTPDRESTGALESVLTDESKKAKEQAKARETESVFVSGGWITGLCVNVLNAKAALWFLIFFTSVVPEYFSLKVRTLFAFVCLLSATGFFCFLALVISRPRLVGFLKRSGKWLDRVIGLAFLAIAFCILKDLF